MSTIQHINSSLDHFWPEYQRRFPAFDKPEIVPAETLRGMAPIYMRRLIDQDPSSYYLFVHADPMRGDASRDRMVEFVDDFFYNKLGMPSSYDIEAGQGGDLPREQAVDKEVMPARDDSEYRRYFDEQMAAVDAQRKEQERQKRIDDLGFDPDDGNTIDMDVGDDGIAKSASDTRAVGQAQTTTVGMPKKIWFCVDFHCPAGGMLGYNGGAGGRLGGSRGGRRFLRESDTPVSDILAAYKGLPEGLKKDMEQIATGPDGAVVVKHKDGKFTVVEDGKPVMERVSVDEVKKSGKLGQKQVTVVTKDEIGKMLSECDDADPEKMMKEFIEKKENGEVEEDEYRRPKNQPHNLHQVDEGEDETSSHQLSPADRDKLVKAIEQRLLTSKGLIGRRLLNPIVKKSDEEQVLVPGFGKPITKNDCLALAQSFDDWKVVNRRNIHKDVPILDALERLLDPSDERLGINVDIPDDAVEYKSRGLYEKDDGEVEEDEYRRPKNQPHNLHQVDESDAWVADIDADGHDDVQFIVYASSEEDARKEAENEIKSHKLKNAKVKSVRLKDEKSKDDGDIEDAEDFFDEDESQFELNESMVRFCDRLIRG